MPRLLFFFGPSFPPCSTPHTGQSASNSSLNSAGTSAFGMYLHSGYRSQPRNQPKRLRRCAILPPCSAPHIGHGRPAPSSVGVSPDGVSSPITFESDLRSACSGYSVQARYQPNRPRRSSIGCPSEHFSSLARLRNSPAPIDCAFSRTSGSKVLQNFCSTSRQFARPSATASSSSSMPAVKPRSTKVEKCVVSRSQTVSPSRVARRRLSLSRSTYSRS